MTRRTYVEVANSYAPFTQAVLQGLGLQSSNEAPGDGWPAGRSYVGIAHFRAPYDEFGYFQDGTLQGIGSVDPTEMIAIDSQAPGAVKRYLLAGDAVSSLRADVTLPFNQIHPYVYGGIALAALATSYVSYKRWKKTHGGSGSGNATGSGA